jgi:hypothetical protein
MIKFKSEREQKEYNELPIHNSRLAAFIRAMDIFCTLEFGKDLTITSLFRTQAEHNTLYANTPIADRPISSVHCQWEGCDLRSTDFTLAQIDRIVDFANQFTFRHGKKVGLYHMINGNAPHLHLQVSKDRIL